MVGDAAVQAACVVVRRMLACSPAPVLRGLREAGALVGIIGRRQVTSDMPGHTYLKLSQGESAHVMMGRTLRYGHRPTGAVAPWSGVASRVMQCVCAGRWA